MAQDVPLRNKIAFIGFMLFVMGPSFLWFTQFHGDRWAAIMGLGIAMLGGALCATLFVDRRMRHLAWLPGLLCGGGAFLAVVLYTWNRTSVYKLEMSVILLAGMMPGYGLFKLMHSYLGLEEDEPKRRRAAEIVEDVEPAATATGRVIIQRPRQYAGSGVFVQVFVDGKHAGHIAPSDRIVLELPSGPRTIQVRGGFVSRTLEVRVKEGKTRRFTVTFSTFNVFNALRFEAA